jgi:hypothetical protein
VWAVPSTALRAGIRARCEGRVLDGRQPMGVEAAAWQAYSINRIVPALAIEGFDTMRAKRVYYRYLNLEDTSSEHFAPS